MELDLNYPIIENRNNTAATWESEIPFLTAFNYRGFRDLKRKTITVVDSKGQHYEMSEAEEIRTGNSAKWWIGRILGEPFRYKYKRVEALGQIPIDDFKQIVISVINANRLFYDSGGETENILQGVNEATDYRAIIDLL